MVNQEKSSRFIQLHEAIRVKDEDSIHHLLSDNVNGMQFNEDSDLMSDFNSLLQDVIIAGNERIVELLIDYGVNKNLSIDFKNFLDLAVELGYPKVVEHIVARYKFDKFDEKWIPTDNMLKNDQQYKDCMDILFKNCCIVNPCYKRDSNFIFLAVEDGYTEVVEELLHLNIDVNMIKKETGLTLLHTACKNKHVEIAKLLIENKADVNLIVIEGWPRDQKPTAENISRLGKSPLDFAVKNLDLKTTRLLLENGASVENSKAFVFIATETEDYQSKCQEILELLVEYVTDGGATIHNGMNYLQYFSIFGNCFRFSDYSVLKRIITKLITKGANINVTYEDMCTPLFSAIESNNFKMVQVLLENNADLHHRDEYSITPLITAASMCADPKFVNILLDHGAEVDAADESGRSPLHFACYEQHIEVIESLLRYNANVNAQNQRSITPLHLAVSHVDILYIILEHGANVDIKYDLGMTPLHVACKLQCAESVRILLEHNASINVVNNDGQTPLHIASRNQNMEIIQILLENGADGNMKDNCDRTPFHLVCQGTQEYIPDIIVLFLEHNIDVDYYSNDLDGKCAMYYAMVAKNNPAFASLNEIEFLRITRVGFRSMTIYDLYRLNVDELARLADNDNIKQVLYSYVESYPLSIINIIRERFAEGLKRSALLKTAHRFSASKIFNGLPDGCIDKVFNFLNNNDLDNFIEAVSPLGNSGIMKIMNKIKINCDDHLIKK